MDDLPGTKYCPRGTCEKIGTLTWGWLDLVLNAEQRQGLWETVKTLVITFLCVNFWLASPFRDPPLLRIILNFRREICYAFVKFMRGYGPQIAALAREIAGLKSRFLFLWNSERTRRTEDRRERACIPPIQQSVPSTGAITSVHPVGHFSFVCVFVVGSIFGSVTTAGSICFGVWIIRLLNATH